MLRLDQVSYIRQGKALLNNVSWQVNAGERWAILGLNGAGKSTLLRLITAEFWKSSGEIEVLGVPFGKGDIPSLRKKIGLVSSFLAERFPTDLLAEQIVLTGRYKSSILYTAYDEADLDVARHMLCKVNGKHLIGRPYHSLSQGEKQLLLIARSLMEDPQLLILDEATVGLDLLARERLLEHVRFLCQQKQAPLLLFVTHHAEEITSLFTHVLLLKEGTVVAQGKKEEVLTPAILSRFYGNQVELVELGDERLFIKPLL